MKKIKAQYFLSVLCSLFLFLAGASQAGAQGTLPIFPGAAGWGTYTRAAYGGGSNPTVYRVTNLGASGSGSLQACVAASGPRICIFETSGVIRITSNMAIRNPYITIAGQTAPNPGIMIRGAALTVLTHDVLVQHIRVRSGDADDGPDKSNRDSLQIDNNTGNTYNVVIDHCSFSWSVDENASIWNENIYNVSVINSIFSEALYLAGHPENPPDVPHSMGFIIGEGIDRTTVAYTLLAHNNQRNIRLKPNSSAEQINTVVYNYGTRAVDTEGNINVIGNQFIPGDNTEADSSIFLRISAARVYTRDNINAPSGNASSPVAALGISNSCILPSSAVLNYVLNYAGARPANRDTVDTRIINEVRNRTGSFKDTVAEAGGWPVLAQNTRALTTPANPHADSDGDGYTNLEEWLHQYSSQVEGGQLPYCGTPTTCSNCCSSIQTCPTAMTTVGTCARCCATTCQTASTDTTAPRVTVFSVTPTTLTVGASITANYTVTDNTALARAELWRAPSGTNCTDTVKTGCVWTQVTSANITGTSRTGTFTSSPTAAGTFYYGLHAVDAANNVGYESAAVRVTVNAATQTCTNCCSTTQTCPTAFTTVGSCTRCCATACQTAPSTGGCPSPLPAGMIFCDDFNDGEASNWDLLANAAISTEQHRSGSYAVKATHNSTVIVRKTFPNTSEFYSEYWYWISPTWSANYNLNGLKFAHIDANGSCVNPPVGVNLWFADNSWYLTGSSLAYPNTPGAWTGSAYDFSPDGGNYTQVRGAWFKIGIYARSNTSGNNDGILRYWIGEPNEDFDPNVKAPRYSSTAYRWNSSGTALFNCLWVVSNIEDSDANSYQYLDDVEIWNRLPGSSGTQTCSNCCSSTQTCPTAMTTVGTCTRCCATACQAASTDATAPRVTAFTITPTTLTVGASLTANYTVTDNTALSRVELWYANYNSTNCNETTRTGCVWNQLVSNNISGTSQSGTIPYTPHSIGSFMNGLHVVDAAGNIGYEPAPVRVTVNAQTQTCTNCCSTTQTCPTAFTTVGTCTRCCASTCQTASACGNGNCETGETCSSCASDCGACPGAQCQKIAPGAAIPAGYGAPYNTLSVSAEQLMNVVCNTNSASVSIGNNSTSQYIYRYGYIWRNNAWQRIDLTGSVPAYEGNWFRGNATATVSLTATELTQENNLIAYICNWTPSTSSGRAGEWKCGCRDSACTTPYWQLQRFGNY